MDPSTIVEISRAELQRLSTPDAATITNVKHLASYCWVEGDIPTIVVPGLPPRWTPLLGPRRLQKDCGFVFCAQNAARHPQSPVEPLFRSLFIENPDFDVRAVDVISDRNNIRKLLQFINPGRDSHKLEPFTINIEVTKNTAILARTQAATTEFIDPRDFRGFGHNFEKSYTISEISKATGHHRVLSYRFAGMSFIVRHETDGYISATNKTAGDSLADVLGGMSLASKSKDKYINFADSKLRVKSGGHSVPIDSTLEIKTRTIRRPLGFDEAAPQLWVSQTPNLVRAYHERGVFAEPKVEDVSHMIQSWEADSQVDLRKLGGLIQHLVATAKKLGGKATVTFDASRDMLTVRRKADLRELLPKDLYARWDGVGTGDRSVNEVSTTHKV